MEIWSGMFIPDPGFKKALDPGSATLVTPVLISWSTVGWKASEVARCHRTETAGWGEERGLPHDQQRAAQAGTQVSPLGQRGDRLHQAGPRGSNHNQAGFGCNTLFIYKGLVLLIRIRISRVHMFLGLPDPDPLVRDPDPSITKETK